MRKAVFLIWLLLFFIGQAYGLVFSAQAESLGEKLAGRILLDVESNGEAWYVYPRDNKRYFLGRPTDAFSLMRELGLGIKEVDFQRLAQADMPVDGDLKLASKLAGMIILEVEKNGEAWYIYPKDLKKYYLGRPADAFRLMRELSLGISREDLAKVHKPGYDESINQYSKYEHKTVTTAKGDFTVDLVEIDLANPNLKIVTDTADDYNCKTNCQAKSLGKFVVNSNGFAGINGTYFCASSGCQNNYYFYPVYNTTLDKLINEDQLKYWTTGPIMAFDQNNNFYYFKDSREFKSVADFEKSNGVKLMAAIGNKPRLIEQGMNLLIEWDIDEKQKNTKSRRNAIGWSRGDDSSGKGKIYLIIAHNATVPDLADIAKSLKFDYALNLDGGFSSALWYNNEYMVGPGRDIPNAIVFLKVIN